ncbi:MAG: MoaD/ThiS family protein [Halanaerobiales bacterium]
MAVKVNFYSLFKINLSSTGEVYSLEENITVKDLIKKLDNDYNGYFSEKLLKNNEIKKGSIVLINGKNILHINGLNSVITNDDEIDLFPPSAGG